MTSAHVDLIIPARNEAANVPALFDAIEALPPTLIRRVIVCDNGSTDQTAKLCAQRGAIVVREEQPGYGAACLRALDWIRRDDQPRPRAVAFFDADLADDPTQLATLIDLVLSGEAHLALGSRHRLAQRGALDVHQRLGNWLSGVLIGLCTGQTFTDMGPMRVIGWSTLEQLAMTDRTWGWTVEMQYKAALAGLRIREVDVPYRARCAGKSKISGTLIGSMKAGTTILATISKLWWRTSPTQMRTLARQHAATE